MAPNSGPTHDSERSETILSDAERLDRLRLIRSQNVGPATFAQLIDRFGSAASALDALPELAHRGGSKGLNICTVSAAEREIEHARRIGARLVAIGEHGYPGRLAEIDSPPPLLYVTGRLELADAPMIAIVGSRNASALGQKFAAQLASDFGHADIVVVSGLARGIDGAAHRAALGSGTAAMVAGGIDVIYPPEHTELQKRIAEDGLLVSARRPGFRPKGRDFPRRNVLIAGASLAVVVVEAAERSGSLITARLAGEQGRDVFAVPGNPMDPRASGTNRLIQEGAGLVSGADDIIDAIAPLLEAYDQTPVATQQFTTPPSPVPVDEGDVRNMVMSKIGTAPVDIDELIRATGFSAQSIHVVLLELDLAGRLERHGRQLVSLRPDEG